MTVSLGELTSDLLAAEVQRVTERIDSLEKRAQFVVASGSALITGVFAIAGLSSATQEELVLGDASVGIAWAIGLFLASIALGAIVNFPFRSTVLETRELQSFVADMDEERAVSGAGLAWLDVAEKHLETLGSVKKVANIKGWFFVSESVCFVIGIGSLGLATNQIIA